MSDPSGLFEDDIESMSNDLGDDSKAVQEMFGRGSSEFTTASTENRTGVHEPSSEKIAHLESPLNQTPTNEIGQSPRIEAPEEERIEISESEQAQEILESVRNLMQRTPRKIEALVLKLFKPKINPNLRPNPKRNTELVRKDYVIMTLIRLQKRRIFYVLENDEWNLNKLDRIYHQSEETRRLWNIFKDSSRDKEIAELFTTRNENHGNSMHVFDEKTFKSYSAPVCKIYFGFESLKINWICFIELLFADRSIDRRAQAIKVICCDQTDHNSCQPLWALLKRYLKYGMFQELQEGKNK